MGGLRGRAACHPSCQRLPARFNRLPSGGHAPPTPPGHGRRWVGEAGSRTGNRKSCEREREEAVGVRGGGSHDVPQLPQSLGENEKMGSLGGFARQAQCPNYLPVNKGGSFATSWAHRCSPPPANTHIPTATVTVTAAQRELPLSLSFAIR